MKLFITQNSYYFMHRFFLDIYEKENCKIIYVIEKKRGGFKKIKEILKTFGFWNFVRILILEFKFFILLNGRVKKIDSVKITDIELNNELGKTLTKFDFDCLFSIGCPTKIDASLQYNFKIPFYNLHGGILPIQKGRFSPIKALKKNDKYLGGSLHLISKSFDDGEVISQKFFEPDNKNKLSNYVKVLEICKKLLEDFFKEKTEIIPKKILKQIR